MLISNFHTGVANKLVLVKAESIHLEALELLSEARGMRTNGSNTSHAQSKINFLAKSRNWETLSSPTAESEKVKSEVMPLDPGTQHGMWLGGPSYLRRWG